MYIVIFTPKTDRVKDLGREIMDKLYLIGPCNVLHYGTTFQFPSRDIVIDIRYASLSKTGGSQQETGGTEGYCFNAA